MKNSEEIREDLIKTFIDVEVEGRQIDKSTHFEDYLRIGTYLSAGLRKAEIKDALSGLENKMIKKVSTLRFWTSDEDRAKEAKTHFDKVEEQYKKKAAAPKDTSYSKLLSRSLDEFEKGHGFVVVGERLPNFVGFVYGNVFKNALEQGEHWKDVGAGKDHGEYSHRLQWYLVISAGAIKSVDPNGEVIVYKSIAKWQKGRTKDGVEKNLWTRLFDLPKTDGSIGNDQEDFRSPENLNLWLTGNENPTFCPVLRSFLRARMAKRANLNADKYLQEKLKFSDEQMGEYQNWLVTEAEQKKRPSKRIVFPQGKKPVLSPYVGEVKEF